MIRLTQFAIREKSVIILLAVGVLLAGVFSWNQLRQELLPDIEFPFVTIITPVPGAGAEDVAEQVTYPSSRPSPTSRACRRCSPHRAARCRWSSRSSTSART